MSDLFRRLDAVEQAEQDVLQLPRDNGQHQNVIVDTKATGSHTKDDQDVYRNLRDDRDHEVEVSNVPLLDRHTKENGASWANMKNFFVLLVGHRIYILCLLY